MYVGSKVGRFRVTNRNENNRGTKMLADLLGIAPGSPPPPLRDIAGLISWSTMRRRLLFLSSSSSSSSSSSCSCGAYDSVVVVCGHPSYATAAPSVLNGTI